MAIYQNSKEESSNTLRKTKAEAVLAFNKCVFNLVSETPIDMYINTLFNGELIESKVKMAKKENLIFLTRPTG